MRTGRKKMIEGEEIEFGDRGGIHKYRIQNSERIGGTKEKRKLQKKQRGKRER